MTSVRLVIAEPARPAFQLWLRSRTRCGMIGKVGTLSADDTAAVEAAAEAYVAAMRAGDWPRVVQSFSQDAVRMPPHEEPHQGRVAIEAWLNGIEELISYELRRDAVEGAGGFAYVRGRYAIT